MPKYARGNPARWWRSGGRWAGGHRSPAAMFISPLRRYTALLTLGFLLAILIGGWWVTRPARLSRLAEVLLSEIIPGGKVNIQSARLAMSGTLVLNGVRVSTQTSGLTVFSADELEVRFDWLGLVTGHLEARQITAQGAALHLTEDRNRDEWNFQQLLSQRRLDPALQNNSGGMPALPVILLRSAMVSRGEIYNGVFTPTGTTIVDGTLIPRRSEPGVYDIKMTERPAEALAAGKPRAAPTPITGYWNVRQSRFSASIGDIASIEELGASLPRQLREIWARFKPHGPLTALQIEFDPATGLSVHVAAAGAGFSLELDEHSLPTHEKFPLVFEDVRGGMRIQLSTGKITIDRDLSCKIIVDATDGSRVAIPFKASGYLDGLQPESPLDLKLEMLNMEFGRVAGKPARIYPRIAHVIPQTRDLIERMAPQGTINVAVSLKRYNWNGKLSVEGLVTPVDLGILFVHFPYPVRQLNGEIPFNSEVVWFGKKDGNSPLTGVVDEDSAAESMGTADEKNPGPVMVTLGGHVGVTGENQHVDLKITSRDAIFDERVQACLPDKYTKVWKQFSPRIRGAFECTVIRAAAGGDLHFTLALDMIDGHAQFVDMPYPLSKLRGKILFEDDQTTLTNVRARVGLDRSGEFKFDGIVRHPGGDVEHLKPELRLAGTAVPIDSLLLGSLPEEYTRWRSKAQVSGTLDVNAAVKRDAEGVTYNVALGLHKGTFETDDRIFMFGDIESEVTIEPGGIVIEKFEANVGGNTTLVATGRYAHEFLSIDMKAAWKDFAVTQEPPRFISEGMAETWRKYKLDGIVDGEATAKIRLDAGDLLRLSRGAANATATAPANDAGDMPAWLKEYAIALKVKTLSVAPEDWPAPIEEISAAISVTPEKIEAKEIAAKAETIAMKLDSVIYDRKTESLALSGSAAAPEVPEKWLKTLGADAAKAIMSQKPKGDVALTLKSLSHAGPNMPWVFEGSLESSMLSISTGVDGKMPVEVAAMKTNVSGQWDSSKNAADALTFTGSLESKAMSVQNRMLEKFRAKMACKEKSVAFTDLDATVAEGKLQGKITVNYDESLRYEGALVLNDADLATLMLAPDATKEDRAKVGSGRVTATLAVREQFGKDADRTGRGELVVKEGKMYDVPLAMGLMQVVTLRIPVSKSFETATMNYYIRDNKVTFEKIVLASPGINLAGMGTVMIDDRKLDMNFATDNPGQLKLPFIDDIIKQFRDQLLSLHVGGTVEKPDIQVVPLGTLRETFENLIPKKPK